MSRFLFLGIRWAILCARGQDRTKTQARRIPRKRGTAFAPLSSDTAAALRMWAWSASPSQPWGHSAAASVRQ
ncbi:hypothetical protein ASZ90_011092 [hydrocarbon metagenome]|uniref:Uncharacterized protein n=1 Tax=hydrocarbon metagenome TaxID=938273 RepID=A0A0W8FEF6_9ZZZZ